MADDVLDDEGRWPAANEFEEVEGALGCAPLIGHRLTLVRPVVEGGR